VKNFKEKTVSVSSEKLKTQINFIQTQLGELKEANTNETKSTAGDKHETGRAMVHLEQEKLYSQLGQFQKQFSFFNSLNFQPQKSVSIGSLVKTSQANYFVSVGIGALVVDNENVFAVSAASPIGNLLLGKNVNDVFSFNGKEIKISEIL